MTQEASFTFTTPLNVNLVEIKGKEHLFVEGDISSNHIDFVNDVMDKHCQDSMQKQVMERAMKLDLEHEAFKGDTHEEKEINKTKIPAGKLIDAMVKGLGNNKYSTRVKGEINPHNKNYEMTKGNLLDGYLDAFSVAFLPIDVKYQNMNGKDISFDEYLKLNAKERIRVLHDVKLLNVALTGNPCNTKAQMISVAMKSMDAVEEYKRLKAIDPTIESRLEVKSKPGQKENPLSYIWNKMMMGDALNKTELKLLKAALDVADNKGTYATLAKELFTKVSSGVKLTYKEYYLFRELIEVDHQSNDSPVMATESIKNKSHSSLKGDHAGNPGNSELNKNKNSKMTDDNQTGADPLNAAASDAAGASQAADDAAADDGSANVDGAEGKATLKTMSAEMKAMHEKYDAVSKDNVRIKEDLKAISGSLAKITEALMSPIHKSGGVHIDDAATKAKAGSEGKSVDPLDLF